ncbi:MAG: hypothetical protein C0462_08565 [Alcanivorax sp.]|nr:hypothetical protein [Alcanivorax sp.]
MTDQEAQTPVAVIGAGHFGACHARQYAAHSDARLVALVDTHPARHQTLAEQLQVTLTPTLDIPVTITAASVATPASTHYHVARALLADGIHVLLEKPMTLSLADTDALADLARAKQVLLQPGLQERYVLDALGLPAAGRPVRLHAVRCHPPMARNTDCSVVHDLMMHDLDTLHTLNPSPVEHLSATGRQHHTAHLDEVQARLRLDDGCEALLEASRVADTPQRRLTLTYTDGTVTLDFLKATATNLTGRPLGCFGADPAPQPIPAMDPLALQISDFLRAVRTGQPSPVTLAEARRALATAESIQDHLHRGTRHV